MSVVPYDDAEIENEDLLVRRINPDHHVVYDENRKCKRISTKAFSPSSGENGGMSVDLPKLIQEAGHTVEEYVTNPVFIASVVFSAGSVRGLDLQVGKTPQPDNPYHADVWGKKRPNRFNKRQQRELQKASEWLVEIPDVELKSGE